LTGDTADAAGPDIRADVLATARQVRIFPNGLMDASLRGDADFFFSLLLSTEERDAASRRPLGPVAARCL
jgi:hypothetical protein